MRPAWIDENHQNTGDPLVEVLNQPVKSVCPDGGATEVWVDKNEHYGELFQGLDRGGKCLAGECGCPRANGKTTDTTAVRVRMVDPPSRRGEKITVVWCSRRG